ncbi:MAG: pyridoxamine 5'-phosphate oxidase family protein [Sedimentisphaerales bacterium]|nr:pyridoxamine 5'-phosphate oxidase family protein [Sedimentisphaerales bacterium]
MNLSEYFKDAKGTGVLATSDSDGNVDIAIYSRPYIIEENKIAFSMLERLSYENVQSNPKAAYLFKEEGQGYKGTRLYLRKCGEETDPGRINEIKKQHSRTYSPEETHKHLVYFEIERSRPLIGDKND